MKKLVFRLALVLALAAAGYAAYRWYQQMPKQQQQIALAKVRRSDVVVRSFTRGELRAVRSATLTAPNLFGTVQVTRLAPLGSLARPKDLIVEFDDAEVQSRLEEKQLELEQIDEQIKKAQADLEMRNSQDQVDLLQARYGVRRAELEVKRNELLSQIDQQKNVLNLEEARKRLAKLEVDIKSRVEQAQAELAVLREKKNKSLLEMGREKQRLQQVKLLAPMGGLIAIKQNRNVNFFFGQQLPDIREGDQLQPGSPVAEVLDLSELEVIAKVGELDRANLREGQEVLYRLDAIAGKTIHGRIKSMSGTATANVFSSDPGKKFDVVFSIDMKELLSALGAKPEQVQKVVAQAEANRNRAPAPMSSPVVMAVATGGPPPAGAPAAPPAPSPANAAAGRPPRGGPGLPPGGGSVYSAAELASAKLPPTPEEDSQLDVLLRPGLLVDVEIIVDKVEKALNLPAQAVFEKDARPIVYLKTSKGFEERPIKIAKRSESAVILESGLSEGDSVALSDPNAKKGDKDKKENKPAGGSPMGGMPAGGGAGARGGR